MREFPVDFPVNERWDKFHLNFGELVALLATADRDAILYSDADWSLDSPDGHYCPELVVDLFNDKAVTVPVSYSNEPVTVGQFLGFLMHWRKGTGVKAEYMVQEETLLFLNREGSVEAVNGIRMNRDGSYVLCTQDPSYLPNLEILF